MILVGKAFADDEAVNDNPLTATLQEQGLQAAPGTRTNLQIKLKLDKNFKAYLDRFNVNLKKPTDFVLKNFDIGPTIVFFDQISKKDRKGVKGEANVDVEVLVPEKMTLGKHKLEILLAYQACTEKICLFPKTLTIPATLNISKEKSSIRVDTAITNNTSAGFTFESANAKGSFFALMFVFAVGVLTSLTPCVYPMIPITLAVLGTRTQNQNHWRGFLLSFTYVTGIGVMFSSLGVLAATSGRLFGSLLGHPWVISFVSLVFFLMSLSMFGFVDFQAPVWLTDKVTHLKSKGKYLSAFVLGIISGVIAAPCVGPVIVSILTYVAQTRDVVYGFILLFSYSLGMGVLFLALGTFSQLTNYLPRSGKWMNYVKYFFGAVMLGMSVYYVSPLVLKKYGLNPNDLPSFFSVKDAGRMQVKFMPYNGDAVLASAKSARPVVIDFYADWCAACVELEEKTYTNLEVIKFSENFDFYKFDATSDSELLDKLKIQYGIKGLPWVVFLDSKGQYLSHLTLTGFEDGPQFLERMKRAR